MLREWDLWMSTSKSDRTRNERLGTLRRLARTTGVDVVTCSWQPLATFVASHPGKGTRVTYQGHLRAFYQWLQLTEQRHDDPTRLLGKASPPKRKPHPLSDAEMARVLATRMHRRTRAMILLARLEGMRVSEIARHRGENIRADRLSIIGKGDKERVVGVHPIVAELATHMPRIGPWFPSNSTRRGQHVTGHSVSSILSEVMTRAGVDATAHRLRHTFATDLLRTSGGNLRVVQEALGHEDPATTAIYTQVHINEIAAAITAMTLPLYVPH